MTNNESIQILRTDKITASNNIVGLLDGQPFYNRQKNYLTVGMSTQDTDGNEVKSKVTRKPITVREVVGYFDDNSNVTGDTSLLYKISPTIDASNNYVLDIENNVTNGVINVKTKTLNLEGSTGILLKQSDTSKLQLTSTGNTLTGNTKFTGSVGVGTDVDASLSEGSLKVSSDTFVGGKLETNGNIIGKADLKVSGITSVGGELLGSYQLAVYGKTATAGLRIVQNSSSFTTNKVELKYEDDMLKFIF